MASINVMLQAVQVLIQSVLSDNVTFYIYIAVYCVIIVTHITRLFSSYFLWLSAPVLCVQYRAYLLQRQLREKYGFYIWPLRLYIFLMVEIALLYVFPASK